MASPRDLTGLPVWWCADAGIDVDGQSRVTGFTDRVSGRVMSPPGINRRPVADVAAGLIRFATTSDGLAPWLDSPAMPVYTRPFTFFFVARQTGAVDKRWLLRTTGAGLEVVVRRLTSPAGTFWEVYHGSTVTFTGLDGALGNNGLALFIVTVNGGSSVGYDGTKSQTGNLGTRTTLPDQAVWRLGSNTGTSPAAADGFIGDFRSFGMLDHAASASEVATLRQWWTEGASSTAASTIVATPIVRRGSVATSSGAARSARRTVTAPPPVVATRAGGARRGIRTATAAPAVAVRAGGAHLAVRRASAAPRVLADRITAATTRAATRRGLVDVTTSSGAARQTLRTATAAPIVHVNPPPARTTAVRTTTAASTVTADTTPAPTWLLAVARAGAPVVETTAGATRRAVRRALAAPAVTAVTVLAPSFRRRTDPARALVVTTAARARTRAVRVARTLAAPRVLADRITARATGVIANPLTILTAAPLRTFLFGRPTRTLQFGAPTIRGAARMKIPAASVEDVDVPITKVTTTSPATRCRGAFLLPGVQPDDASWVPGSLLVDERTQRLVGARIPYAGNLPRGRYIVWVEVGAADGRAAREPTGWLTLT